MAASLIDNQGIAREIALLPSTAIVGAATVTGAVFTGLAGYQRAILTLTVSDVNDDSNDTLDVYVDVSPDNGATWVNAVHFDQFAGDGTGGSRVAVLNPAAAAPTADIDTSSDASAGDVRPYLWGSQMRARYVTVDPTGTDAAFTVVLTALLQR